MTSMDKNQLRAQLLAVRPHSSEGLTDMLLRLVQELKPNTLASFQPISGEPAMAAFNSRASALATVVYPRITGDDLVFAAGEFTVGAMGIREPSGDPTLDIDLILVPALAVDKSGMRLGRGRGFYDRALTKFPEVPKFAVIFESEFIDAVPADPWDVRVDGVVTPERIVKFD